MRARTRTFVALATAGLATASGACVAVFGMDELSEKQRLAEQDGSVVDAGTEAGDSATTCATDELAELPGRPATAPAADGGSVYFALNQFDMGTATSPEPAGFDLDHRTTTDLATNGCAFTAGDPAATLQYGTDRPGGVDNTTSPLLNLLANFVSTLAPGNVNDRLTNGKFGAVIRVDGWNGTATDDSVIIQLYPTIGLWDRDADGGLVPVWPPVVGTPGPSHTRSDLWIRDARFKLLSDGSTQQTLQAWVVDGKLVARFTTLMFPIRTSIVDYRLFDMQLRDAWLTATLTPGAGGGQATLTQGIIAGRIKSSDFIDQARFMWIVDQKLPLCSEPGKKSFNVLTSGVCGVRDMRSSHCEDGQNLPCDSLSFAARFETYGVDTVGPFYDPPVSAYADAGLIPPNERCNGPDDIKSGADCP